MNTISKLRCAVIIAALFAPALGQSADVKRSPITHEALWLMKRVGAPVVSPDGRTVAFSVVNPSYDPEKQSSDIWVVPADGSSAPRQVTFTRAAESGLSWSPDSRKLAFSTKREGDESEQIYVIDLISGGEAQRVTHLATPAVAPKWRPDGAAILFETSIYPGAFDDEANRKIAAERKALKSNVRIYDHSPIRFWNRWLDDRRPTIMVQSLEPGAKATDILSRTAFARSEGFAGDLNEGGETLSPIWSPDGMEIVFIATQQKSNAAHGHVNYRIYRLPATGDAEPRQVSTSSGSFDELRFSPDGGSLFARFAVQDEQVYHLAKLKRYDWVKGGELTDVLPGFDREVSGYEVSADGRSVYFRSPAAGNEGLYRVAASGGTPSPIVRPNVGGYTALTIAKTAAPKRLIAAYGSSVNPTEIFSVDPKSGVSEPLTRFNTESAAAIDWSPPEHFTFVSRKGRTIHSMIIRPPGFDAKNKYPLLVFIHGGAASNNPDQIGLRWNYHLLAAAGYVILMTDYTGSTGFGEAFAQAIKLDPLKTPGEEIDEAVDVALKRYSFIDGARMCASGASYGGHLVNWIEATSTRYRCLISHAGEVDLLTQWGESDGNYGRELTNGGPPWDGGSVWRSQSPITYGAQWKTPMLLSVGEKDFRVPIGNALENWAVLQHQNVPSRMLVWPDAGHWITKAEDSRKFYDEVHAWLKTYLSPKSH